MKTKRTTKKSAIKRVSCDDIVEITGEALERISGGIGGDVEGGGGEMQLAGKTWRDSPPNLA